MAMKFKISKKEYEALSDEMKPEYVAGETAGEYVLDVTGLPEPEDTGPLQRALEKERQTNKTLKTENGTLKQQIADFPDVEALKATHAEEVGKFKKFTETSLIDGEAAKLAAKISTAPALLLPIIKARLMADVSGDAPVTKVLGADGKPSDLTIEKLGEEIVANKDYAAIIIGSKASGSVTPRNQPSSKPLAGGMPAKDGETFDASKATPADLAARIKERKEASAQQ